jgi:hypothetical protein
MLVLDAQGTIQRANVAAAHLTLDKGIQEGTTCFWEVFGEGRDFSALRQQTLETLASVVEAKENSPGCVIIHADQTLLQIITSLRAGWFQHWPAKDLTFRPASSC